jgi:hypothetical protein
MAEVAEQPIVGEAGAQALNLGGLDPIRQKAYSQYTQALGKYDKKIDSLQAQRKIEVDKKEAERKTAIAARDKAEGVGAVTQPLPDAPKFTRSELTEGPQLLMALAAFSGMVSRQPLTASLNAMAGLIQGINTGDKEKFETSYKEFEGNYKKASELNRQAISEFDKLMKRKDLSITEIDREMHQIDVKYGTQVSQELRRQQGLSKVFEAWVKLKAAQDKMDAAAKRLSAFRDHLTGKGKGQINPLQEVELYRQKAKLDRQKAESTAARKESAADSATYQKQKNRLAEQLATGKMNKAAHDAALKELNEDYGVGAASKPAPDAPIADILDFYEAEGKE